VFVPGTKWALCGACGRYEGGATVEGVEDETETERYERILRQKAQRQAELEAEMGYQAPPGGVPRFRSRASGKALK